MMALSIRQPWAWFILEGAPWKDYENRDWTDEYAKAQLTRCPVGSNFLIHASAGMTVREFDEACAFAVSCGVRVTPRFDALRRGGIVGMVKFEGMVRSSSSPWFCGPLALKLSNAYPLPFRPLKGMLGFFNVEEVEV